MSIARKLPLVILALIVLGTSPPAEARRSGSARQYAIRCVSSECSDRYHYRAPKSENAHRATYGGRRSPRY